MGNVRGTRLCDGGSGRSTSDRELDELLKDGAIGVHQLPRNVSDRRSEVRGHQLAGDWTAATDRAPALNTCGRRIEFAAATSG
jgi:hypothetical protein